MATHLTPVYQLAYADTDTALGDLGTVSEQLAESIEAALLRGGVVPPAAADLNAVTARVVTLETAKTADEGRLTALEQLARCTVTGNPNPASSTSAPGVVSWTGRATTRSTASMWAAATPTQILVPVTGEYDLDVWVPWAGNLTGIRGIAWRIGTGGWTWLDMRINPSVSTLTNTQSGRFTGLELTAGQYIEIGLLQSSGAALAANGTRATLALRKP